MFKKTNKEPQFDIFASVPSMLDAGSFKQYNDENHWHNQYREQVVMRIDESIYKVLFSDKMGAPNASISILVSMMILKEAFGWSDSQLFEHCRFNLLTRSALGLFNINDPLPAESTYYLLRKRIYEYQKQSGEDLLGKTFEHITREQIKEFEVNGRSIRMDSKLIGSNIAFFTRYEIIHQTLCRFYKTLDKQAKFSLSASDRDQLEDLVTEEPNKTVYRSTKEEIKARLQPLGILIYKILNTFAEYKSEQYQLLQRVFSEQYKVVQDQQIELRAKEEISSDSVQSPHDPDCAYRNKSNRQVKGYNVNITETCSENDLNLITSVIVDKASICDVMFVEPAVRATLEITSQEIEKLYADGSYQSPVYDELCKNIDMVFTGIHGFESRYDLEMTQEGLFVTDTQTGKCMKAVMVKKWKNSIEDRWKIKTTTGRHYFNQQAIGASNLRRTMKGRPIEESYKRNNVEATIFQLSYPLRNNKTKYRGMFKQQAWAFCRCLWINLVRIINFTKHICQRTFNTMEIPVPLTFFHQNLSSLINYSRKLSWQIPSLISLFVFVNYNGF